MASPVVALVVSGLVTASCSTSGLSFKQDERVTILAPADRAEVRLPVTVRWKVNDFEVTGPTDAPKRGAGYFGVFVDRSPQPSGKTVDWLVADDVECKSQRACDDPGYLAARGIFTTSDTSFTVTRLNELRRDGRRELHEVIVVLLDGKGRRLGEGAFVAEFSLDRSR